MIFIVWNPENFISISYRFAHLICML